MDKETMLKALFAAEQRLPQLLENLDDWHTLDVDYEPPRVERMWTTLQDGSRLYLHKIYPCKKALFHPHPWPSAIKVLSGVYEMGVGTSATADDPTESATILLTAGTSYEMIAPNGWHYVRPLAFSSLSLMLTGAPWAEKHPGLKKPAEGKKLRELTRDQKTRLATDIKGALHRLESYPNIDVVSVAELATKSQKAEDSRISPARVTPEG